MIEGEPSKKNKIVASKCQDLAFKCRDGEVIASRCILRLCGDTLRTFCDDAKCTEIDVVEYNMLQVKGWLSEFHLGIEAPDVLLDVTLPLDLKFNPIHPYTKKNMLEDDFETIKHICDSQALTSSICNIICSNNVFWDHCKDWVLTNLHKYPRTDGQLMNLNKKLLVDYIIWVRLRN